MSMDPFSLALAVMGAALMAIIAVVVCAVLCGWRQDARIGRYQAALAEWDAARCWCGRPKCAWSAEFCPSHAPAGSYEAYVSTPEGRAWAERARATREERRAA